MTGLAPLLLPLRRSFQVLDDMQATPNKQEEQQAAAVHSCCMYVTSGGRGKEPRAKSQARTWSSVCVVMSSRLRVRLRPLDACSANTPDAASHSPSACHIDRQTHPNVLASPSCPGCPPCPRFLASIVASHTPRRSHGSSLGLRSDTGVEHPASRARAGHNHTGNEKVATLSMPVNEPINPNARLAAGTCASRRARGLFRHTSGVP